MNKTYYGAYSYMGTNYSYDSDCWEVYGFSSATERDEWVNENPTHKEAVTRPVAYKILSMGKHYRILQDPDGRLFKYPKYLEG